MTSKTENTAPLMGQSFIDSQKGVERREEWNGGVYIIRDVWVLDDSRPFGFRLERCEYAVKGADGSKIWKPCKEGVRFSDIEWFEVSPDLGRPRFISGISVMTQVTQAASPTLHLRWNGGVLQQMWTVSRYEGGKPSAIVTEWRDVPRFAEVER